MLDRIPGHNNNECSGDKSGSVMSNKNIGEILIGIEERAGIVAAGLIAVDEEWIK